MCSSSKRPRLPGDKAGALRSLRRATAMNGSFIDRKYLPNVLAVLFSLEVSQMQYAAALETHDKIEALKGAPDNPERNRVVAEIRAAIDGSSALGFPGVIEYRTGCAEGRPNWQHELLRRKFTFDQLEGPVDDFELRCDWKRVIDEVSTEKTWEVPESWGWCQVFVFGEICAKLKLIEYPLEDSQRGLRVKPVAAVE